MKCPNCNATLRQVLVAVAGAEQKVRSFQCPKCDYFSFEPKSAEKVIAELRSPLRIHQRIVKLSANRLGMYFNRDVVRSLRLRKGAEIAISVPDKRHMVVEIAK
ncbi:MAG TPA: zf-TFIIB domain-containing protein [Candidatus Nanoarchaeia archaeon]|nr:zf-TFIIB domain-containing protein [Candidatus Nanoarchaeia archaeon]